MIVKIDYRFLLFYQLAIWRKRFFPSDAMENFGGKWYFITIARPPQRTGRGDGYITGFPVRWEIKDYKERMYFLMTDNNPIETPIEIINAGNGMPGIAPCMSVPIGSQSGCPDNVNFGGGGGTGLPGICDCWFTYR